MAERARLSDGSSWPLPDQETAEDGGLSWRLRYAQPSRWDLLAAASIIDAYGHLLMETTAKQRALIVREVRSATADAGDHR